MKFSVYRLSFSAGVHFGTGTLWSGANTLPADTLFSALCLEAAAQRGEAGISALVDLVRQRRLCFSDLFPFIGEELGTKHSLNVSVTTGIIIWDFFKQLSD